MIKKSLLICVTLVAGLAAMSMTARLHAQLPAGFDDTTHITGLTNPTAMAYAPDGRLFICERAGAIKIFKDGQLLATPFAQMSVRTDGESGLMGIAIDPVFATQPYVYIYYTDSATRVNRVSRLTASGDEMAAGSELVILDSISPGGAHNGGCIRFGMDEKLYIATGDSGDTNTSQSLSSLAGKILRINKDGTVPTDNPFVGTTGARPEIYCLGLRNPFRFSFRPGTNTMYIADVGGSQYEEINIGQAGGNYGWPIHEGPSNDPQYISPMYSIPHDGSSGGSVTGGCFITNPTWPTDYQGNYYYGDWVYSYVARLVVTAGDGFSQQFRIGPCTRPVDYIQGLDGDLYYANLFGGIQRLWYSGRTAGYDITTSTQAANGGENIQINWTVPAGRPAADWIAIFKIGEPNTAAPRWSQSTGGAANGSVTAALPNEQGTFEVRYLDSAMTVLGRSKQIQVTAAAVTYSLVPSATTVEVGAPLSVSWTAPPGSSSLDWISIFRVGDPNTAYGWWRYTGGATTGTFALNAPMTPGQYEFRYLLNNGFTDVARSATVTVNMSTSYTLVATPSTVQPGEGVSVTWTAPTGSSNRDWIGLYRVGDDNRQYISWIYTGGSTSGSHVFTMPAQLGEYEFRYLLNDGYTDLRATSNTVLVTTGYSLVATPSTVNRGGSVTVSWTAPPGSSQLDWIGLFRVGDANVQYYSYTYTNGATSGSHIFIMPIKPGQYEFRYLLNDGYTDLKATSNTVTIP